MSVEERLRTPPKERLAADVQHIDLACTTTRLRAEMHAATSGHRQVTLVRRGPVSIVLFVFEQGGALKEHKTDGEVTVQILAGEVEFTVGTETMLLTRGSLVSMAPGQPHSLKALQPSEMLLTICLQKDGATG